MEWQPIETAPKDGTVIMLWSGDMSWMETQIPSVGWYALGSMKWVSRADWLHNTTHWMPLPEPPEDK